MQDFNAEMVEVEQRNSRDQQENQMCALETQALWAREKSLTENLLRAAILDTNICDALLHLSANRQ